MTATASRLTAADLDAISQARELADANDVDDFRRILGEQPDAGPSFVYAGALGKAQYLLGRLADLAEQVTAEAASAPPR